MKLYNKLEECILTISLLVMVLINFGNVISRYFIHASWSFSEEIMIILFVWNTMIATALAFKHNAHLGLSVFTDLFPMKYQNIFTILIAILTVVLMGILTKFGIEMVNSQVLYNIRTPALDLPEWVAGASIPVGALLIVFRVIESAYIEIKGRR